MKQQLFCPYCERLVPPWSSFQLAFKYCFDFAHAMLGRLPTTEEISYILDELRDYRGSKDGRSMYARRRREKKG